MNHRACILAMGIILPITARGTMGKDYSLAVEPGTEWVQVYATTSGPMMLVARRTDVKLDPPVRGYHKIGRILFKHVPFPWAAEDEKVMSNAFARTRDFAYWSIFPSGLGKHVLVASDMEGTSPLDQPDNPIARLWLLPISFGRRTPVPTTMPATAAKREFWRIRGKSKISYVKLDKKHFYEKVRGVVAVSKGNNAGVCVGLTPRKAIWAKEFTTAPLAWARGGGVLEGSFDSFSAAIVGKKLLVAASRGNGAVDCFWAQSVTSLSKARRQRLVSQKDRNLGPRIRSMALTASAKMCVLGLLVETEQNTTTGEAKTEGQQTYQLETYACPTDGTAWKPGGVIPLVGRVSDLSLLIAGNKLVYAYLSTHAKEGGVSLHVGMLPEEAWKPDAGSSMRPAAIESRNPDTASR